MFAFEGTYYKTLQTLSVSGLVEPFFHLRSRPLNPFSVMFIFSFNEEKLPVWYIPNEDEHGCSRVDETLLVKSSRQNVSLETVHRGLSSEK